jgi:hypothetical protein
MNLQDYFKQLRENKNFQDFQKENPQAYLCSGFFTIDKEATENQQHLDFFIPGKEKIFSFQMEKEGKMKPLDTLDKVIPEKLSFDLDLDFDNIEKIIKNKMEEKEMKDKIKKLIFSLQRIEKKNMLMGTIFISGFGLLKANIDLKSNEIIDFERKSFFDMIKVYKKKD